MRYLLTLFAIGLVTVQLNAQKFPFYENFEWDQSPTIIDRNLDDPIYYYNQYDVADEYIFDQSRGIFFKYEFFHYRVFLNKHAAVDDFNKVYISLEDAYNVIGLKARLIKPSGEVVDIDPEVEEFYNSDEGQEYIYFPVSGIEVGDEIEVMYTLKKDNEFKGSQVKMQGEIPIFNSSYYLVCPNWMKFKFVAHNGYPEPVQIDTIIHLKEYYAHADTVPAYKREYYSEYNNTIQKIDVALYKYKENTKYVSYSPFEEMTNTLNTLYNQPQKKSTKAKLIKSLKANGVDLSGKIEDQIRAIELFVKLKINFSNSFEFEGVLEAVKNKRTTVYGVMNLYMMSFDFLGIDYEYGLISDRYDTHFSDQLESEYFFSHYFFYFPQIKKYMSPLGFESRLGYLPPDLIPNNAMFVTQNKTYNKSEYDVKPVPCLDYTQNKDSVVFTIDLDEDLNGFTAHIEKYITGYDAGELQSYYYLYNPNKKEEKLEKELNILTSKSKLKVTDMQNLEPEDAYVKPLILKGKYTNVNEHFLDKADGITIFKLGNIFGDFLELKEIEDRVSDYVFYYPFENTKTVIINLPSNVKISKKIGVIESDKISEVEGIEISAKVEQNGNQFKFIKHEKYIKQRVSKTEEAGMLKIFQFYNDLANMNLILEKK